MTDPITTPPEWGKLREMFHDWFEKGMPREKWEKKWGFTSDGHPDYNMMKTLDSCLASQQQRGRKVVEMIDALHANSIDGVHVMETWKRLRDEARAAFGLDAAEAAPTPTKIGKWSVGDWIIFGNSKRPCHVVKLEECTYDQESAVRLWIKEGGYFQTPPHQLRHATEEEIIAAEDNEPVGATPSTDAASEPSAARPKITKVGRAWQSGEGQLSIDDGWALLYEDDDEPFTLVAATDSEQYILREWFPGYTRDELFRECVLENPREGDRFVWNEIKHVLRKRDDELGIWCDDPRGGWRENWFLYKHIDDCYDFRPVAPTPQTGGTPKEPTYTPGKAGTHTTTASKPTGTYMVWADASICGDDPIPISPDCGKAVTK